ncbi:MAG: type II toxin-antitoxin system RelE/ParE family toxin [Mailhella sp.]|nr:type II toxin-antitoxin system RelE/ParE family toxin [Mailhella sp.]
MASKRLYRLSPLAERDLEDIWLYTLHEWSADQADRYHRSIIAAIEGLLARRNVPQPADILPGYWKFKVGKHIIYFKENDEYLDVIRILHARMDVENHLPG